MSAMTPYNYQLALDRARGRSAGLLAGARGRLSQYRGKLEAGIGATKTVAEVVAGAGAVSFLSARYGGPAGKNIGPIPLELVVGGVLGAVAMSGYAGKHSEDVLALGIGAVAAYATRLGFEQGLKHMAPKTVADIQSGKVSGFIGETDPGWVGATPLQHADAVLNRLAAA